MPAAKAKPKKINFTKSSIEVIKAPETGRTYIYDQKTSRLAICVTNTGLKSWYWYGKVNGKPRRKLLGKWPDMTVEQARKKAESDSGKAAEGRDPTAEQRLRKGVPTLEVIFDDFILAPTKTKAKRPKSPKTVKEYRQLWNAHLKECWGPRKLSAITRQEIERLHNSIGDENGSYIANRVLSLLKALFNHAVKPLEVYDVNPAATVSGFEEHSRERFLGADEIAKFMAEVEAEPSETVKDFIKLALFTGQRRSNVQAMKWEDINLELGVWTIPQTKTGKHTVPLTNEAIAVLRGREKSRGQCEYVLPGRHGYGHLKDPMKQWRAILDRAGLKDLRIHDLRRTLGSWQAGTGSSLLTIGKALGHKRLETVAVYSRLELKTVRDSMQTATAAIADAAKPKKTRKRRAK